MSDDTPRLRHTIRPINNAYSIEGQFDVRPSFLEDWSKMAACIGRWELFDGVRKEARNICWNECQVRKQCLASALTFEKEMEEREHLHDNEFASGTGRRYWRYGTRGGYKPSERSEIADELAMGANMDVY
jgi:hypothetical protein